MVFMKLLYLDLETTGLNPYKNGVIQIAGIIEIDKKISEEFDLKCNIFPRDEIVKQALECNGITTDQIKSFPDPEVTYDSLINILRKYVDKFDRNDKFTVVGQNVIYDLNMLRSWFYKNNDKFFGSWFYNQTIDLLQLAALLKYIGLFPVNDLKLTTMAEYLGLDYYAHDALSDIRATRTILKHLINNNITKKIVEKGSLKISKKNKSMKKIDNEYIK